MSYSNHLPSSLLSFESVARTFLLTGVRLSGRGAVSDALAFSSYDILIEQKEIGIQCGMARYLEFRIRFLHGLESFLQPWLKDEDGEQDQIALSW